MLASRRLASLAAIAAVAAFLVSNGVAFAAFDVSPVHSSLEQYFDDGVGGFGTKVGGCVGLGCPSSAFDVGSPSGLPADLKWKVEEI